MFSKEVPLYLIWPLNEHPFPTIEKMDFSQLILSDPSFVKTPGQIQLLRVILDADACRRTRN